MKQAKHTTQSDPRSGLACLPPPLLRLHGTRCNYGAVTAVHATDLEVFAGDFVAILGPSGCGKSTLLRMIGGFVKPDAGVIEIDGRNMTEMAPEKRPVNMVFQGYGLFPHMNVRQNIGYGLRVSKRPAPLIRKAVDEMLALVHLSDFQHRSVSELSGGQQQRVALARVLILRPKVLLLDEPLAALDLKLRQILQEELRHIHAEIGGTFIFVTHDQTEALALANRIAVMERGRIVQVGNPREIYRQPRTEFVARFIGDGNFLSGSVQEGVVRLHAGCSFPTTIQNGDIILVLRPENLRLVTSPAPTHARQLQGTVGSKLYLGNHTRLSLTCATGETVIAHVEASIQSPLPEIGEKVAIEWREDEQILIPV